MGLPCSFADLYEKDSSKAYTPWMYYAHRKPDAVKKPLFWLDLDASTYWSFQVQGIKRGKIVNLEEHIADVYFREPVEEQCIDRIEWVRNNEVYATDYYDGSGIRYAEAVIEHGSESLVKYFDPYGKPAITVWTSNGFVAVKKERQEELYESQEELNRAFLKDFLSDRKDNTVFFYEPGLHRFIPEGTRCALFITDQIPDELKDQTFRESLSLIVTGRPGIVQPVRQLCGEGGSPKILETGTIIDKAVKHPARDALIVTRSQYIEQLQSLVEGLPELHFHIAAGTMMAPGLMEFGKYDNVTLYPNMPRQKILKLMENVAFYLDINHYLEYEGIVWAAQRMDRLVYAFENTVHQRESMPSEHIYPLEEANRMIADISRAMFDPNWLWESLEIQRQRIMITDRQKDEFTKCVSGDGSH